jgi:Fe-S oxidoreductase
MIAACRRVWIRRRKATNSLVVFVDPIVLTCPTCRGMIAIDDEEEGDVGRDGLNFTLVAQLYDLIAPAKQPLPNTLE